MNSLQVEISEFKTRIHQQELEMTNIENIALKQRFQESLNNLLIELQAKEQLVRLCSVLL